MLSKSGSTSCKRTRFDSGKAKAPAPVLSGDVLRDIFARLPVDTLHRFTCVSKHWLSLISCSRFVGRYIQSHQATLEHDYLVLHLVYDWSIHACQRLLNKAFGDIDMSPLSQVLSSPKLFDFSFSFLPMIRDCPGPDQPQLRRHYCLSKLVLLGASHGLLFCKMSFKRSLKPIRSSCFYVCNPLTKQWLELPPLPRRYTVPTGPTGFSCHPADTVCDLDLPLEVGFTAVEIEVKKLNENDYFIAHVFSSKSGSWAIYYVACPRGRGLRWLYRDRHRLAAYKGIFYWDAGSCIVAYDPLNQPEKCSLIKYPQGLSRVLHVDISHQGKLRVIATLFPEGYGMWELMDNDGTSWTMTYKLKGPDTTATTGYQYSQIYNWIITRERWSTGEIMLLHKDDSVQRLVAFTVTADAAEHHHIPGGSALPFSLTPWPTPIPKLPSKDQNHDGVLPPVGV